MTNQLKDRIDKIKKLLSKTKNNPYEDEVQAAYLLAQRMMVKWGIESFQVDEDHHQEKEVEFVVIQKEGVNSEWKQLLALVISKNFRCETFASYLGSTARCTFLGLKEDAAIAAEVYISALSYIKRGQERCAKFFKDHRQSTNGARTSYAIGFVLGLKVKFEMQVENEGWGLALVKDPAIEKAKSGLKIGKAKRSRKQKAKSNSIAMKMGFDDGKKFGSSDEKSEQLSLLAEV